MKRTLALLLLVLLIALLCGCGREKALEPWTMPAVDARPTPVPTPAPAFGGGSPERTVWNEDAALNMSDPGAAPDSVQETLSHTACAALFPYNFLPAAIFGESHAAYEKLSLRKTQHEVMLDAAGRLAEHAYVEYLYLPKSGRAEDGLTVMAELCSYEAAAEIDRGFYPHLRLPEDARPKLSAFYFREFVLARAGEQRVGMLMKLTPGSYFTDAAQALAEDESFVPARQVLLTVTCGENVSDEAFLAALRSLLRFSDGSELPPPEESRLPVFGEKGAA